MPLSGRFELEMVSTLPAIALSSDFGLRIVDFRAHPEGPGPFLRISASFVAHLVTVKQRSSRLELRKDNDRRGSGKC